MTIVQTLVRKTAKVTFYVFLSLVIARILGNPESWMSDHLSSWLGHFIYGSGEIGADNFYDLYFYISIITVFSITTIIYILSISLINKTRKK